jgi:acyl carrier protein
MAQNKLKEIMASVFKVDVNSIEDDASPDNVKNWDSLHQMNLVLALEETFSIEFTYNQSIKLLNYKKIVMVLKEHGIEV